MSNGFFNRRARSSYLGSPRLIHNSLRVQKEKLEPVKEILTYQRALKLWAAGKGKSTESPFWCTKVRFLLGCVRYRRWCSFSFFFFFFGWTCSKQKFPGQGSNPQHSSNPSHCSDNTWSLTHRVSRELLGDAFQSNSLNTLKLTNCSFNFTKDIWTHLNCVSHGWLH